MMASTTATRHGRIAAANAMLATRITSNGLMANAQNDLKLAFLKDVLTTIAHTPTVRQKVVSITSRTTPCSATTVLALTKKATSKLAQWLARCELTRLTDFGLMLAPHSALWSFRRLAGVGAKLMMRTNAHQARGHLLGTMQPTLAILARTSVALDTSGTIFTRQQHPLRQQLQQQLRRQQHHHPTQRQLRCRLRRQQREQQYRLLISVKSVASRKTLVVPILKLLMHLQQVEEMVRMKVATAVRQ